MNSLQLFRYTLVPVGSRRQAPSYWRGGHPTYLVCS